MAVFVQIGSLGRAFDLYFYSTARVASFEIGAGHREHCSSYCMLNSLLMIKRLTPIVA